MVELEAGTTRLDFNLEPIFLWYAIYGYVTDDATGKVIPGVLAEIPDTEYSAISDAIGQYWIENVPCRKGETTTYTVRFSHPDYETKEATVRISKWEYPELNVELHSLVPSPEPPPVYSGYLLDKIKFTCYVDNMLTSIDYPPLYGPTTNVSIWFKNTTGLMTDFKVNGVITYPSGKQVEIHTGYMTKPWREQGLAVAYISINEPGIYKFEVELSVDGQFLDSKVFEREAKPKPYESWVWEG